MLTYSPLLNRLCPFDNKYSEYTIHSVILQEHIEEYSTEQQKEVYAWALRSKKTRKNTNYIDDSTFQLPKFSHKEIEQLKSELDELKIPYIILN